MSLAFPSAYGLPTPKSLGLGQYPSKLIQSIESPLSRTLFGPVVKGRKWRKLKIETTNEAQNKKQIKLTRKRGVPEGEEELQIDTRKKLQVGSNEGNALD